MCYRPDPFLTYLKAYGYNVVRLPKADLKPLQMLFRQGRDLVRLGELATVFVPTDGVDVPPISPDQQAANINGQRTGNLSIGVGLTILGSVIGAMGGSKLGLKVHYKEAHTAAFEFSDVLEDSIELAALDQYLGGADINPLSVHAATLLEADDVYIITHTIKSKKFTLDAEKSNGTKVELEVPVIQEAVGGEVTVSADAATKSKVTYAGQVPLVFGFQAIQLYYDDGRYTAFKPLAPGVGLKALEKLVDDGATRFVADGAFARVREL